MTIAVLGSRGMLGSMVAEYLGRYFEVRALARPEFDALNPDWAKVEDCDWVINCIGIIPQKCKNEMLMYAVNVNFPQHLADHAQRVIHPTTDCCFSGTGGEYTEKDECDCLGSEVYGASKWYGEVHKPNVLNLRCSLVGTEQGSASLLGWLLSQPQGAKINGFQNHLWNGITTLQFARICRGIIETKVENFYPPVQHVVPADWCSKRILLEYFAQAFRREDIIINPVLNERMINRKLATVHPDINRLLWQGAGYSEIPTIKQMVQELAEYKLGVTV